MLARHVSDNSYTPYMLPAVGLDVDLHPSQQQATYKVLHTKSCIQQSNAPEDGHNSCSKHVELTLEF